VRTYQLGPHADLSQQILNELAAAKTCLSDPGRKVEYDELLRQQLRRLAEAPQPPPLPPPPPSRPDRARLVMFAAAALTGILLGYGAVILVQWSRVHTILPPPSSAQGDLARAPSPPQPKVVNADDRTGLRPGPPQAGHAQPSAPATPPPPPKQPKPPVEKERRSETPLPVITPPPSPPPAPQPTKPKLPASSPKEKPGKPPHEEESPPAAEKKVALVNVDKSGLSSSLSSDRRREPNLSGTWRSQLGSIYRLTDKGDTITVSLIGSPDLSRGEGVLVRASSQLVVQQWRCMFKTDPRKRWWALRFQAQVRDEQTLDVQYEMLYWDARWNVYDRRYPIEGVWRKIK
jgi:hypothetical protein